MNSCPCVTEVLLPVRQYSGEVVVHFLCRLSRIPREPIHGVRTRSQKFLKFRAWGTTEPNPVQCSHHNASALGTNFPLLGRHRRVRLALCRHPAPRPGCPPSRRRAQEGGDS